jgi:large subunit ribosomal protein L24
MAKVRTLAERKKKLAKKIARRNTVPTLITTLKAGDKVMVLAGGNSKKGKTLKGQVGKILRMLPKKNRVVVEGVNMIKRHKRAMTNAEAGGVIVREGSIALSNVMFYSEEHKRPFRLHVQKDEKGKKVRGIINPKTKAFEAI